MGNDSVITVALGKGRLAKKAMECFEKIGIPCPEMKEPDTRKLIFEIMIWAIASFLQRVPMFLLMWSTEPLTWGSSVRIRYLKRQGQSMRFSIFILENAECA